MAERAEKIDQTAADWIARRDGGQWSAADEAALEQWLNASTRNRVAWLRLNAAWDKADELAAAPTAPKHVRIGWRPAAAAAIAATLLASVFVASELAPDSYATSVGGSRAEMLADGSRLELNTDSRIRVRQTDERRVATLDRGEAFFTVSRDASRPFLIEAGDFTIAANDGAFSVYRQGARVLVAVERGEVSVARRDLSAGAAEPVICTAGSVLEARPEATRLLKAPTQVDRLLSWRRGLVTFEDARLADVVAEFNRYNKTRIVITDPALAEARVGGAFRPTSLDAFIRILAADLGVVARREDDQIILAAG